jgi:hypothetical protein
MEKAEQGMPLVIVMILLPTGGRFFWKMISAGHDTQKMLNG